MIITIISTITIPIIIIITITTPIITPIIIIGIHNIIR
jgi:hypothetical protein